MADGTQVTATVGNGDLTPSVLGAVRSGWHSMPPYDGRLSGRAVLSLMPRGGLERDGDDLSAQGRFAVLERDGDDSPRSRVGSLPSSEAETIRLPEGRLATLE